METFDKEIAEVSELSERVAALMERQDLRRVRKDQLSSMVGEAKTRVARQPKAQEFLERLQERAHAKSVGLYEELLTAVVQDVLPGEKSVGLTLKTARGLPSLEIEMVTASGQREGVLEGSGGSLANVLSAGLRVIALARSGAYPFLVLDEPDCWLKPSRVPQFANVLGQIAEDLGIQVLLVSHHDPHYFARFSSQVALARRGGKLEASWVAAPPPNAWDGAQTGIKEIRLFDFMSHESTVIPLSPGVTCLTGENDIGKSAIVSGLRALFYGDGKDGAIAHGKPNFRVEALFHDDGLLSLERYAKKSPKQRWRYYVAGQTEAAQDSSPKDGAPEWVEFIAKIARSEDLDIAFANQKSPVFLLDKPPPMRASILAVGRESAHLQRLISKNKTRNMLDASLIREGESEGARIDREMVELARVDELAELVNDLRRQGPDLAASAIATGRARLGVERLSLLRGAAQAFERAQLHARLEAPCLERVDGPRQDLARWMKASKILDLSVPQSVGHPPALELTESLAAGAKALRRARAVAELATPLAPESAPLLAATSQPRAALSRLAKSQALAQLQAPLAPDSAPLLAATSQPRAALSRLAKAQALAALREPDALDAAPRLDFHALGLREARRLRSLRGLDAVEHLGEALAATPEPPKLDKMEMASAMIEFAKGLSLKLEKLGRAEEARLRKSQEIKNRLDLLVESQGGLCPTCQGPLDAAHLMKGLHHG
jgi:predicted ATPase